MEPTFTDALVVLGYLNRHALAGGSQPIDPDLAEQAIRARLADPLGLDLLDAAYGVYRIAIATMSRALRAVTSERGRDPRDFALIGFGGAGPACAAEMALEFGINTTIIPMNPGLFSAVGLMVADIQYHDVISNTARDELDATAISDGFGRLEQHTVALLHDHGYGSEQIVLERFADMRYAGLSSELRIRVPPDRLESAHIDEMRRSFDAQHERTYGHSGPDQRVELVNLRLRATYTGDVDARRERSFRRTKRRDTDTRAYVRRRHARPTSGGSTVLSRRRSALGLGLTDRSPVRSSSRTWTRRPSYHLGCSAGATSSAI